MPAHAGAEGNEVTDQYAKDAATDRAPRERFPEGCAEVTSLAHMARVATEARSRARTDSITAHVRPGRRYRPPPGNGVRRTQLRRVRKTLAGRYYQLLSGHAETGTHRHRFDRTDVPDCWWCASGEPRSRHHLFTRCPAWRPQTKRLRRDVGEALRRKRPQAPSLRYPWEKATSAALEFLRTRRGASEQGEFPQMTEGRTRKEWRGAQARPRLYPFLSFFSPLWPRPVSAGMRGSNMTG